MLFGINFHEKLCFLNLGVSNRRARKGFNEVYNILDSAGDFGYRPMPGITGLDIEHKASYGSLRQATVKFQCWDIHQLEQLELLYMRPGYTALIEWGWLPYIDNSGKLRNGIIEDNFFSNKNVSLQPYLILSCHVAF